MLIFNILGLFHNFLGAKIKRKTEFFVLLHPEKQNL